MRLKQVEQWWRRVWIRFLVRLMRRPHGGAAPQWGARPWRVLFLRHDRAGDMILSTGVLRAIAASHPTISLDVLASPANAAVLGGAAYVHDVVIFDKRRLGGYLAAGRRLRAARYDAVIDCMVTAPSLTTLLLVLASGAEQRIGISGRGNDAAFTLLVPPESRPGAHMADLLAALARAFEVDPSAIDRRPSLVVTSDERARASAAWSPSARPRVLVNISAGTGERTWPDANYVALLRHLTTREPAADRIVIAGPSDAARAARIADAANARAMRTPSIRDAFALVESADVVVTPDTSIAHAASAFRTPAVVLFVRGKAERWGLYRSPGVHVEHADATLATLPLERVLRALDELLDERRQEGGVRHAALRETR
jgi:ADP-heptose:LPS heptosyltransferase